MHKVTSINAQPPAARYRWNLPQGFPEPVVPADNPMTDAKVELGRHLFYDTRLSGNGTFSCASCHVQSRAFADALPRGVGSTGEVHPRGSMSLANVAYSPALTWANPLMTTLEKQALVPMFGEDPVELGLSGDEVGMLQRVRKEPRYATLFAAAYPGASDAVSLDHIVKAIASFQRTLISGRSPYDTYKNGRSTAITASARRGEELFFSEKTECFHCHGGFNFTGTVNYVGKGFVEVEFHNTALYNIDGQGGYPAPNTGVHSVTHSDEDMGRFKAPSLRNIAVTAPYMHDGSVATLEDVLEHYDAGGRTVKTGPNAGIGADSPLKSEFIKPMGLTAQEKRDLVAFLRSLTDSTFLRDPRFTNPWRPVR
ncbi:MAG: di-heme enzyme [Gemmatimonadaceae bacterium]|nr:di-heme enzyme [Gemmatimonadaceae bacterium]